MEENESKISHVEEDGNGLAEESDIPQEDKEIQEDEVEATPEPERLTRSQKIFFIVVLIFTAFLIYLKFVWEPQQRDSGNNDSDIEYNEEDTQPDFNLPDDFNPEDFNPEDYGLGDPDSDPEDVGPIAPE